MSPTPSKLNLNFARNAYSVFGTRGANTAADHQREQKTELLEGKSWTRSCESLQRIAFENLCNPVTDTPSADNLSIPITTNDRMNFISSHPH